MMHITVAKKSYQLCACVEKMRFPKKIIIISAYYETENVTD